MGWTSDVLYKRGSGNQLALPGTTMWYRTIEKPLVSL